MSNTVLDKLQDVLFSELSPDTALTEAIKIYEEETKTTLYPASPERKFVEALVLIILLQNKTIDYAAKMNYLAYATGPHLDHMGALMDTERLSASPAITSLRYSLAESKAWPVLIPQGSRVSTGSGGLVFATDHSAQIEPGDLSVEVAATCITSGSAGNGLLPGQINKMVDMLPDIKSCENISTSVLGADDEDHDPYRERIHQAPEKFSVAGPEGAYRYHAMSVHQDIADCAVWRSRSGVVDIRPIMKNGVMPSEDILERVCDKLNDKTIRPITDTVNVGYPEIVFYSAAGSWTLLKEHAPLAESITRRVNEAVEEYRLWQRSKVGRDINPTRLISLMERAGAYSVNLTSPVFTNLEPKQVARDSSIDIKFGGVVDE